MAHTSLKSALLGGASLIAATAAFAQEAESEDIIQLDPIEIYGDRAADTIDQTQTSVAVIPEERLNQPTTQTITDTFRQTVNVTDGDFTESGFVIRGINSEGLTPGGAGAPLASIYIDGVQQTAEAARRGMRGVFDAEQVEIYRGPQSTLTGRNALAGAIYVRTKDPDFGGNNGQAQFTYGENNKTQVGLAYGGTLSDNVAYRLSGEWSSKDSDLNFPSYAGYPLVDDLTTDEYYTVRGKLLWLPTHSEDTRVLLSYSHSKDSPDTNQIAGPNWNPAVTSYDERRADIYGTILPSFYPFATLPVFQDVRETTVDNVGLEITHDFNSALRLTALTSFSDSTTDRRSINYGNGVTDPTNSDAWFTNGAFDQRIISQEVRLNYDTDSLRWVGGLYLADETNKGFRDQKFFTSTTSTRNKADIANYALFGEVTYEFAPNWNVIAGGRIDYYKQDQTASVAVFDDITGPGTSSSSSSSHSETAFIPKIGVTYDIDSYNRIGLIYQEGYRPGGSGVRLDTGQQYNYDTENAKNIALSWRGSLMNGRMSVGANIFYQDWDNQQVEVWQVPTDPTSSTIVNAGESESYGGEIEVSYQASDVLNIYGGLGLLKTEFKDFSIGGQNLAGQPFSNAPEQSLVIGFIWGEPTGWFAGGNIKYTGKSLSRIEPGSNRVELHSYTTVDAQFGYTWDNGLTVTAYATNLFDETYLTYDAAPGNNLAALGARREIGLRLNKTF